MKNKKVLLYYLLEFVLTIFVFITILLLLLKLTMLNKNYITNILEKNNYYHEVYLDINNDYENYLLSSGFDKEIIKDIFTEEQVKKDINNMVDNYYQGKEIKIATKNIKEKLELNIENYLDKINITITDEDSLNLFKEEILNIYNEKIILHKSITKYSNLFSRLNKIILLLLLSLIIIDIFLFIIIKKLFRKITLTIPIISSMLLLLLFYTFFLSKINIKSIIFWNDYVSKVIKNIFIDINNNIKLTIIIGIILEFVKLLLVIIKNKRA